MDVFDVEIIYTYQGRTCVHPKEIEAESAEAAERQAQERFTKSHMTECEVVSVKATFYRSVR